VNRAKGGDRLTHTDPETGEATMVDISSKSPSVRSATAVGRVMVNSLAFELVRSGSSDLKKGHVLSVARLAGIMAAKQTSSLIPLCHPLQLSHVAVELSLEPDTCSIWVEATARCEGKTGVEMEALTAASVACLTVWDMVKSVSGKDMVIADLKVIRKTGGKSGDWYRDE
jgi:molybdenum cofactor biosynthesis protein MoaC